MKYLSTLIFALVLFSNITAQSKLKNNIDVRFGYGGIDGLSGMTFLSAAYGREIKNGFILKGSFLKGSGVEELIFSHSSVDIYGLSVQKAVNTSGRSSINLSLGYRLINLQSSRHLTLSYDSSTKEYYGRIIIQEALIHGVDVDLSYLYHFNERIGVYAGANFTSGIAMFSVNVGSRVYF